MKLIVFYSRLHILTIVMFILATNSGCKRNSLSAEQVENLLVTTGAINHRIKEIEISSNLKMVVLSEVDAEDEPTIGILEGNKAVFVLKKLSNFKSFQLFENQKPFLVVTTARNPNGVEDITVSRIIASENGLLTINYDKNGEIVDRVKHDTHERSK